MLALFSAIVFLFAVVFHGAKVTPSLWLNWQGLALIGLLLLAAHLAWVGPWPYPRRPPG